jgi:hypothetical protein
MCKKVRIKSNLDSTQGLKCKTEGIDSEFN